MLPPPLRYLRFRVYASHRCHMHPSPRHTKPRNFMHRLLGGHIISAAIQTNRKNCSVNDAGGREAPTYSSERVGAWRSRPIEAHENKQLSMAWDLPVASS